MLDVRRCNLIGHKACVWFDSIINTIVMRESIPMDKEIIVGSSNALSYIITIHAPTLIS